METVDDEVLAATTKFIDKAGADKKPFFVWFNTTRMHIFTHLKPSRRARRPGTYPDGMVEHDGHIGQMLKKLDDLGITDDTIVIWTTDNGAEVMSWPDGGTTPFRGEKNTNWEGGYRVPLVVRWPGSSSRHRGQRDHLARGLAADAAGRPRARQREGVGTDRTRPRRETFRSTSTGTTCCRTSRARRRSGRARSSSTGPTTAPAGLRFEQWKMVFLEQRAESLEVWQDPWWSCASQAVHAARRSVRARRPGRHRYKRWRMDRVFMLGPAADTSPVDAELQGLPAAFEARDLQPQPRDGEAEQDTE
jgi:arylsulfatase